MRKLLIILTLFAVAQCRAQKQDNQFTTNHISGCIEDTAFLGTRCDTVFAFQMCYTTYPAKYADIYKVRDSATGKWRMIEIPNQKLNEEAQREFRERPTMVYDTLNRIFLFPKHSENPSKIK